jgi:hypothetical protein
MAASMAWVSNGLRFFSPLRSRRPAEGLMRFWTAASGTYLTRKQIVTDDSLSGTGSAEQAFGLLILLD